MRLIIVDERLAFRAESPELGLHAYGDTRDEALEEFIALAKQRGVIEADAPEPLSLFTITESKAALGCAGKSA